MRTVPLSLPRSGYVLASSVLGRLPNSMLDLSLVLLLAEHNSYAVAGVGAGLFFGVEGLAGPWQGRAIDRWGWRSVAAMAAVHLAAMAVLVFTGSLSVVFAACVVAGASRPPMSSTVRASWSRMAAAAGLAGPDTEHAVNKFETMFSQSVGLAGPALVWVALLVSSPALAVMACGVGIALAALALRGAPEAFRREAAHGGGAPWRQRGYRVLLIGAGALGLSSGALQIGLPALSEQLGSVQLAPWLFVVFAIGGLASNHLGADRTGSWTMARCLGVYALAFLLVAAAGQAQATLVAAMAVAGLAYAPVLLALYRFAAQTVTPSRLTEAFAGKHSAVLVGGALGAAAAGPVADYSPPLTLVLGAVWLALGAAIAARGRASLAVS